MTATETLGAALALLLALATGRALGRFVPLADGPGRAVAIDGLRGYLALAVYLHHGALWHEFVRGRGWYAPLPRPLGVAGSVAVQLFFMVTAYLFTARLLASHEGRPVDWPRLAVARLTRLVPVYAVAFSIVLAAAAWLSDLELRVPLRQLLGEVASWAAFTIPGRPSINGVGAGQAVAWVTWTLPYEWFFYLLLPLGAVLLGRRVPRTALAVGLLGAAGVLALWSPRWEMAAAFLPGVVAAFAARDDRCRRLAATPWAAAVAALALVGVLVGPLPMSPLATVPALGVLFVAVACGSSLLGALTWRPARVLGEVSYGVYLLHGAVLFVAVRAVLGTERAMALTPVQHWALVVALAPVVVVASVLVHRLVERPGMALTAPILARLRG